MEILHQHLQVLLTLEHLQNFVKVVYELSSLKHPNFLKVKVVYEFRSLMESLEEFVVIKEFIEVLNFIAVFTERTFHLLTPTFSSDLLSNLRFA